MTELKKQYEEKLAQKEELRKKMEHTEMMLDRASKLVSGLAGEKERWQETIKVLHFKLSSAKNLLRALSFNIFVS